MLGKRGFAAIVMACFFLLLPEGGQAQETVPLSRYLEYVRAAADQTWESYDGILEEWRAGFDPDSPFGYRAPGQLLEMAVLYAHLYEKERQPVHAERVRKVLNSYGDFRSVFPAEAEAKRPDYDDGVPALPDFFTVKQYIRAFETLHRLGALSEEEIRAATELIVQSMEYLLRTAEWGTMNRTVLRAETLAWAVRALPEHPRAPVWEMQRKALGDDNWGNWEIEDATIYHGVWLYALMGYADAQGRLAELFRTPEIYYYAHYFLNLMSPADMVPDFGDANWESNWYHFLVFFETAAAQYNDPRMKWAAQRLAARFVEFARPDSAWLGCFYLDCARWGSDRITAQPPMGLSQEVMEDVQGKKIVFRNGWEPDATYLLLNYRDEGDGGMNFRDYLRDTIPVEEEKMTHGHADENSLVLLMSGGSVLLHDGGYREIMPSGPFGAFRQDYFHNRLCVRPEKIFMGQKQGEFRYSVRDAIPGQSILDFLHNAGSYRPVRTRKVDFISLPEFDYSRTRLIDDKMGYEWDRVICYVKDPEVFLVFDIFKAVQEDYYTLANLWHTRQILAQGEHWYDTGYDQLRTKTLPQDKRLLIAYPHQEFRLQGTQAERRHYQDEIAVYQYTAHHFELGETDCFITALIPHGATEDPATLAARVGLVEVQPDRAGAGVTLTCGDRRITVGVKQDLRMDICRDNRRPRYTYESGKIRFNKLESNGDFVYFEEEGEHLNYTVVNLTRAVYDQRELYQVKSGFFGLTYDGGPETRGAAKVRYWRDRVKIDADEN